MRCVIMKSEFEWKVMWEDFQPHHTGDSQLDEWNAMWQEDVPPYHSQRSPTRMSENALYSSRVQKQHANVRTEKIEELLITPFRQIPVEWSFAGQIRNYLSSVRRKVSILFWWVQTSNHKNISQCKHMQGTNQIFEWERPKKHQLQLRYQRTVALPLR